MIRNASFLSNIQ